MSTAGFAVNRLALRRKPILPLLVLLLLCGIGAFLPISAHAIDRNQARFRKFLTGRNDMLRMQAMQSIPRDFGVRLEALPIVIGSLNTLRDDSRFSRAEKQGLPDLPYGVRLMINFVGTVDRPEATEALVELLSCGRTSWVMAATQTLGKHQHHAALEPIIALLDSDSFDASYGFRFTLARSLKDMKHPDAWEGLFKLAARIDGQLAYRIDQEFETVTAEDFADDTSRYEAWRKLVDQLQNEPPKQEEDALAKAARILRQDGKTELPLPERMSLSPSQSAASYASERRLTPSHYYGINIYAKRLLFVIDRSGSMKEIVAGQTRMHRAKRALITAVSGLDQRCEFGIVIFDKNITTWREELVQATDKNKRNAIRFVEYLSAGKTTNTYGALRRCLEFDPQLEAIFLLTDGQPTTGLTVDPAVILRDILGRNETHNITINTIAIAVEPLMETFLRNLSKPSNGEFRKVH